MLFLKPPTLAGARFHASDQQTLDLSQILIQSSPNELASALCGIVFVCNQCKREGTKMVTLALGIAVRRSMGIGARPKCLGALEMLEDGVFMRRAVEQELLTGQSKNERG